MAAQKLTQGRLVQIVVMMLILVAAFTWRTATYDNTKTVGCTVNTSCSFDVVDANILITNHNGGFLIETLEINSIEIEATGANSKIEKLTPKRWMFVTQDIDPAIYVTSTQQSGSVLIRITKPDLNNE